MKNLQQVMFCHVFKESAIEPLKLAFTWLITAFFVANTSKQSYSAFALSKISKLALVGYYYKGAYSPIRAFFMRSISMHSHFMAKLEGDTFECAGFLCSQSTNPFQLCHLNYLVVIGKAPIYKGAH